MGWIPPWRRSAPQIADNGNKVLIYQSELDYMSQCILDRQKIETGGNLFGLCTPFGIPFIQYVVGPGPEAIHEYTHFRQDFRFLDRNADLLVAEHALHHIGSWHSHHNLGLAEPSSGDSVSTFEGIQECGLQSFLLIIGNCRGGVSTVRPFRYFSDGRCEILNWVVLPGVSPVRKSYDLLHHEMVHVPSSPANMAGLRTATLMGSAAASKTKVTYPDGYWLSKPENMKEFAQMVNYLKGRFDSVRVFQKEDKTVEVEVQKRGKKMYVHIDMSFPMCPPVIYPEGADVIHVRGDYNWNRLDKPLNAFIKLLDTIEL